MSLYFIYERPPDSGEKIGLQSVIILTIINFLQYFLNIVPENSTFVPRIAIYFYSVMSISTFSLILSAFILVLHNRESFQDIEIPRWVNYFN